MPLRCREVEWVELKGEGPQRRAVKCHCGDLMEVMQYLPKPDRVKWVCPWCTSWCTILIETGRIWSSAFFAFAAALPIWQTLT